MKHLLSMGVAVLALATVMVSPARAEYPDHDIHVICGYAPGTGADIIVRYWTDRWKQVIGSKAALIVDNKVGALTAIAAEGVKNAKPDGYTVFITAGNSTMASNPFLLKELKYDPQKDFTPVTSLMRLPFIFGVSASKPIKSMSELTAYLKEKGDKASYGYSSAFAISSTELYQSIAGTKAVGISYKGTPEILPDLESGALDFISSDATLMLEWARQGKFRPLAVTFADRSSLAPDVPGMKEAGIPGFDLSAWWGVWLPKGAPDDVVAKIEKDFNQIVADPKTKGDLVRLGAEPFPGNHKVLGDMVAPEMKKWGEVIKLAKIEPQ